MTSLHWPVLEVVSRLLERDEREAVLGDLIESGEGYWRDLLDVLGLVVRRQLGLWRSWRPWLSAFGLALPGSLMLMGLSVSVSLMCLPVGRRQAVHAGLLQLLSRGLLLVGCSWACGFVMGSLSRRTLWVSVGTSGIACLFCLVRFREPSLSSLCLFLFLLPASWGVVQALRSVRIHLPTAVLLAITVTALAVLPASGRVLWVPSCLLIWPAWYIAATVQKANRDTNQVEMRD